jgi:Flp pilus assembly protein TadG
MRGIKAAELFASDESGSITMLFALTFVVAVAAAGAAIDFGLAFNQKERMQAHADTVAISTAKALTVAGTKLDQVKSAAMAYSNGTWNHPTQLSVQITIPNRTMVEVNITQKWKYTFGTLLTDQALNLQARSVAKIVGSNTICVLALDLYSSGALSLTGNARIEANGCGAYSNSTSTSGLSSYKGSLLKAAVICSAGGVGGGSANFDPPPLQDCPALDDPLADREPPTVGGCTQTNKAINSTFESLSPGVYCGGLKVTGSGEASLLPGVYVMKDGPLEITHTASLSGDGVGFYFTGERAVFLFAGGSSVNLSAPTSGAMAGLLFFEDRNAPSGRYHEIVSENARRLVGTIYLPKGNFSVSSQKPVADLSDYTAVIANKIQLNKYPVLVLNSNYGATDVPVPQGLTTAGAAVTLSE